MAGRGAERDEHDHFKIEKVIVWYHIGCLHEYSNSVMLHPDYPDHPGVQDDINEFAWPDGHHPPYHPPSNYITERVRQDLGDIDDEAFRRGQGEASASRILQVVGTWEPVRY